MFVVDRLVAVFVPGVSYRVRLSFSWSNGIIASESAVVRANDSMLVNQTSRFPNALKTCPRALSGYFALDSLWTVVDVGIGFGASRASVRISNVRIRHYDSLEPIDALEWRTNACDPPNASGAAPTSAAPTLTAVVVDEVPAPVAAFVIAFVAIATVLGGILAAHAHCARRAAVRRWNEHVARELVEPSRSHYGHVPVAQPAGYEAPTRVAAQPAGYEAPSRIGVASV